MHGKTVVVTGATSGIGEVAADRLAPIRPTTNGPNRSRQDIGKKPGSGEVTGDHVDHIQQHNECIASGYDDQRPPGDTPCH